MRKIEKLEEAISESYAAWSEEVEYAGDWWEHTHYSGRLVALDDVREAIREIWGWVNTTS